MEMKLTKISESELLIHKEDGKGGFINIIINVCDIEIMHIASERKDTWNKFDVSIDDAINFWNEN